MSKPKTKTVAGRDFKLRLFGWPNLYTQRLVIYDNTDGMYHLFGIGLGNYCFFVHSPWGAE